MKKILIILIGVLLFSSCKSKYATTRTHTNTRKVSDRANKVEKPLNKNLRKDVSKTIYNHQFIDNLYADMPKLNQSKIDYIKKYSPLAINEMEAYKIPASIKLAQGLLESRFGQSELTSKSKNHFGIKCHKWTGKKVYHDDDAKGECFRKYDYDTDSYRDHSLFLANKKRYAKLFTYAQNDYKSWAKGLRKAGYATDKRYPQKLINIIEEYKLYVFDNMVLGNDYKPKVDVNNHKTITSSHHIVELGETLYSISGKYYVSVNDIKYLNNLKSDTISKGQKLKLIGKTKLQKEPLKTHIIIKGDTLYSLSKKYNVTVEKLKTLNVLTDSNLTLGQEIKID